MRSINGWKRRPGCRLAALQSRRCNWRTWSMDSRPSGWLEPVLPVMPLRVLARPTLPPQGPLAPLALFVASLVTTTVPSDSRCAALVFAGGLYEPRCPDSGRADGPLTRWRKAAWSGGCFSRSVTTHHARYCSALQIVSRIRLVERLVAERKVRHDVVDQGARQRRPVEERRVDDFHAMQSALAVH